MAKAKKERVRHSQETIDGVLARLNAGESGAQIARGTGISEGTISLWKTKAATAAKTAAKAEPKAPAKAARKNGSASSNGHAESGDAPSIQLTGLRAWVRAEVRAELKRVIAGGTE